MKDLNHDKKKSLKLKKLPIEFNNCLKMLLTKIDLFDELFSEIESNLLIAINEGEINSGHSQFFPNSIRPNIEELLIWSIPQILKDGGIDTYNPDLSLAYLYKLEQYELFDGDNLEWSSLPNKNSKTITNYMEMLPIIKNRNEKHYHLMGELPYLGIQDNDGKRILLEEEIWEPYYNTIKINNLINLENCI